MKIEIVVDPTRAAPGPSLAARVAPATVAAQPNGAHNANTTRSALDLKNSDCFLLIGS